MSWWGYALSRAPHKRLTFDLPPAYHFCQYDGLSKLFMLALMKTTDIDRMPANSFMRRNGEGAVSTGPVARETMSVRNRMRYKNWKALLTLFSLLFFPVNSLAQQQQQRRILIIDGEAGQANVIEKDGRAYVDVEALTQITHGSLSFKSDRIVLSLPALNGGPPTAAASAEPSHSQTAGSELSRNFMRAGIEEIATIREWASTLANAIQNGYPVTEKWEADYREQAAHDLRLASAAVSNEADRNALQLLTNEFEVVREWSSRLLEERKSMNTAKYAMSENALREDPTSQKVIACGHFLATMLGSGSFQDGPSCH